MILLTALAALLALAAWVEWHRVQRAEAKDRAFDAAFAANLHRMATLAERHDAMWRAMDRGMVDDHTCELCGSVTAIRELVALYDDAALACPGCADLLKLKTRSAA